MKKLACVAMANGNFLVTCNRSFWKFRLEEYCLVPDYCIKFNLSVQWFMSGVCYVLCMNPLLGALGLGGHIFISSKFRVSVNELMMGQIF